MNNLLEIKRLRIGFQTDEGRLVAVDDVSITVREGEVLGLVGESGCGKSVTALSILRLIPCPPGRIEGGRILFRGQDLLQLPLPRLRDLRGREISIIFQEPMNALSPLHRIGDQLAEVQLLHRSIRRTDALGIAEEWLKKVGIPDPAERMHNYPFQLSGGMLQRVMIAMALMLHPALIIADEPTTALDVTVQAQILELLKAMRERNTAVLLITHDMGVIWETCDRVAVMYAAQIVEVGAVQAIFEQPRHPYTQALLESLPPLTPGAGKFRSIPGQVPSPMNFPAGCRFNDRCPHAMERCRRECPPLYRLPEGTCAACFLLESQATGIADPEGSE